MKKVITSLLVAASLFGSAKVNQPKVEEFWQMDSKYECTYEKNVVDVTLIGSTIMQFGTGLFTHINSEYDIYSKTDDERTLYVALMKEKSIRVFSNDGSFFMDCKKK